MAKPRNWLVSTYPTLSVTVLTKASPGINASMFSIVPNPFTGNSKREKQMQQAMDQHARDRDTREATNRAKWESGARANEAQRQLQQGGGPAGPNKSSLAARSKFQFEADEEDDAMENEIDGNLGMSFLFIVLYQNSLSL